MPLYKIKINLEHIVETDDEGEVLAKIIDKIESNNETFITYIDENSEVVEVCPHCEEELKPKMVDVDGTNLKECLVCPKCNYGMPALL